MIVSPSGPTLHSTRYEQAISNQFDALWTCNRGVEPRPSCDATSPPRPTARSYADFHQCRRARPLPIQPSAVNDAHVAELAVLRWRRREREGDRDGARQPSSGREASPRGGCRTAEPQAPRAREPVVHALRRVQCRPSREVRRGLLRGCPASPSGVRVHLRHTALASRGGSEGEARPQRASILMDWSARKDNIGASALSASTRSVRRSGGTIDEPGSDLRSAVVLGGSLAGKWAALPGPDAPTPRDGLRTGDFWISRPTFGSAKPFGAKPARDEEQERSEEEPHPTSLRVTAE